MIIVWIAVAIVGMVIFLWFFPVTLWFQALISESAFLSSSSFSCVGEEFLLTLSSWLW